MKVGDKVTVVLGPFKVKGNIVRLTPKRVVVRDETFFTKTFDRDTGKLVRTKEHRALEATGARVPACYFTMG